MKTIKVKDLRTGQLIKFGLGDKAHREIETAKMIILNFDDLNQEVEEDEINRILAK